MEEGLQSGKKNNEKRWECLCLIQLGRVVGKTEPSNHSKAEELIGKGVNILDELGVKPWFSVGHLFLGELYGNAGQKEKALENLKKAESMFQEMGMDYWLGRTRKVLVSIRV